MQKRRSFSGLMFSGIRISRQHSVVRGIPYVVFIKDKEVVHALAGLNTREQYERVITSCGNDIPLAECKKHLEQSL
jgi:hypothetical protein